MWTEKLEKVTKVYTVNAVDISLDPKTYGRKPRKEYIPEGPNKTGGIPNQLKLGVGSRAMLRQNINVNHGLVNGAMGVIRRIDWPALSRQQLEAGELLQAVFVEFDDSSITGNQRGIEVRIEPCTSEFDDFRGKDKNERRMLPFILCWAVTVHKLQARPKKQLFSAPPVGKFTISSKSDLCKSESCVTLARLRDCIDEYSTPMTIAREKSVRPKAISMEDLTPTKRVKREKDCTVERMIRPAPSRISKAAAAARVARFMAVSAWRRRRDEVRCLRKTLEFQVGCSEKLRLQVRVLKGLLESDNGKVRLAIREIDRLKELLQDKEQQRVLLQKEKMALEEDLCIAEDMASEMRIGWQNTRNQLEGTRAAMAVCEHALALERAAVAEARAQRDHAYARLEAQEEELSQYSALLTAAEAERAEVAALRERAESALTLTSEKLIAEIKAREEGARECASLVARIALYAFEVETLKGLVEQLRDDLAGANAQLAEAHMKLEWWPRRISKLMTATRSWIRNPNSVLEVLFWALLPMKPSW